MARAEETADIQARTFHFAARILKLVRAMERDTASPVVAKQVARSGTGIGANVEEAQGAYSRADFIHRMNVARKEARETLYWLRLIAEVGLLPKRRLTHLTQESEEILRILVAIVKTSRRKR
jgi:four helix bundle protein